MNSTSFIEAASRGKNELWRYAVAIPVIVMAGALSALFLIVVGTLSQWIIDDPKDLLDAVELFFGDLEHQWQWGQPYPAFEAIFFAANLISIFLLAIGPAVMVRFLHNRSVRSLVTGDRTIRWRLLRRSLLVGLIALGTWTIAGLILFEENYRITTDFGALLTLVLIVLLLVPFQALGEEILFRGYILQGVALFSRNPAVRLLVPSALFFVAHLVGTEMSEGGLGYAIYFAIVALYFTWLVIRTDGLEASLGIHIAVNFVALTIFTYEVSSFPGPSLYYVTDSSGWLVTLGALWIIAFHYWFVVRGRSPSDQTRTPVGSSGSPSSSQSSSS